MSVADQLKWWLRPGRSDSSRLAWAFVISLTVHLALAGGYYTGKQLGWWQHLQNLHWVKSSRMLTALLRKAEAEPARPAEPLPDIPLVFVEVSPAQATPEAPKNAQYYSSHNSQAANPDADQDIGVPKITGHQEQVAKTEDVPRDKPVPLQPALPATPAREEQEELKPKPAPEPAPLLKPAPAPADLALAKPPEPTSPQKDAGQDVRSRPRTIKEALARKPASHIPGEKMKQDGGVRRRLEVASLDAKATPFGAYDAMLVEAISQRWFSLLDERDFASDSRGKVVVHFKLHQDGRVTGLTVAENTAGEVLGLLCQKAVLDPAPFAAWPTEMRRLMGESRSIQFTFYYN